MNKIYLIEKAKKSLENKKKNNELKLEIINDITLSLNDIYKQDYSLTLFSDTAIFFRNIGFKVKEISTYYEIKI